MNSLTSAILVIIIVALLATIAYLVRRTKLAIAMVVLIGVLLSNSPGSLGLWSDRISKFTLGAPKMLTELIGSFG